MTPTRPAPIWLAKAIPGSRHANLTGFDAHAFAVGEGVGKCAVDDTTKIGVRTEGVVGKDNNVGFMPMFFVLVNSDIAQSGLTVAKIKEDFGGAFEVACEPTTIVVGWVPFKRDLEVEGPAAQPRAAAPVRDSRNSSTWPFRFLFPQFEFRPPRGFGQLDHSLRSHEKYRVIFGSWQHYREIEIMKRISLVS